MMTLKFLAHSKFVVLKDKIIIELILKIPPKFILSDSRKAEMTHTYEKNSNDHRRHKWNWARHST